MSQSPSFDDIVYANATPDSNSQLSMNPQIAIKILADCPLNIASVSEAFQLDSSRLYANERHVLSSLSYNLFFTEQDVAMLTDIVPSQAWLGLSFASDRSARISFKERTHSGAVLLTQAEQSDLHYHSPSTDLNAVSPLFTPNRHPGCRVEPEHVTKLGLTMRALGAAFSWFDRIKKCLLWGTSIEVSNTHNRFDNSV
ncbi:hypothetical protein BLNAU_7628 [Blattamonas nauphoetae]|uniref:Uncharacterized protein n=1 Tax=Blattamonas nauphoetae TaxID=2049346 RepID=A0ABQ9Y152_9EUKA|nr:hypothetical protein BLNAU_7628 [Blattamonas nauphoetae]